MSQTIAFKVAGSTTALSVGAAQHAAVAILVPAADMATFAAFLNTGAVPVCVVTAQLPVSGTAATPAVVFPVDGTPTVPTSFMLPGAMTQPLVVTVPVGNGGFSCSAIGSAAGPSIIYVTPIAGN